jgi:RecB family exonuclease
VVEYRAMTMADLAMHLSQTTDDKIRWKLVWAFLEEYRWEPSDVQPSLLRDEPSSLADERWDALLAALAEHLAAQHDLAPPAWTEMRVLREPWFPAELKVQRADALVRAPAAFRKHGVYLSAADLDAA